MKSQQQQQQRPQPKPFTRRRQRRSDSVMNTLLFVLFSCSLLSESAFAFSQLQMAAYKPPVKSSVSKIRSPRWSSSNNPNTANKPPMDHQAPGKDLRRRATASASIPSTTTTTTTSTNNSKASSFQQRMRGLVTQENAKVRIATKQRQSMPSNVCVIETLQEYKELFINKEDQNENSLVVVRFYAPWCRACKAIQPIFYKMATQFPAVQFVDVPCTEKNANLHSGLEVPSLPYCHVYQNGLREESKLQRKHVPQLARKLQSYVQGRCDLKKVGDVTCPYLPMEDETDGEEEESTTTTTAPVAP